MFNDNGTRKKFRFFSFDDSSLAIFVHSGCIQGLLDVCANAQCTTLPPKDFAPLHPIHPMIARTRTLNRGIVRAQWVIEACNMLMQMA